MTDRKLTQGTALSSPAYTDKFYAVPAGGSPPWGYETLGQVAGYISFGGTLYPIGTLTTGAFTRFNGGTIVGDNYLTESGGTVILGAPMSGGAQTLHNFKGKINAQTGTTYSTVDADNGQIITLSNASAGTVTVHSGAVAGFNCLLVQKGAGQFTIAAGGTGAIRNRSSHTKLAGQYALVSVFVESNAGSAPQVYIAGDTSS